MPRGYPYRLTHLFLSTILSNKPAAGIMGDKEDQPVASLVEREVWSSNDDANTPYASNHTMLWKGLAWAGLIDIDLQRSQQFRQAKG